MPTRLQSLFAMAALAFLMGAPAHAASSNQADIAAARLHPHPHPIPPARITEMVAQAPKAWTVEIGVSGDWASNPEGVRDDTKDAAYAAPYFAVTYQPSQTLAGWTPSLSVSGEVDRYTRDEESLDLGVAELDASLTRGVVTARYTAQSFFDHDFNRQVTFNDYALDLTPTLADPWSGSVSLIHRASDDPDARREILQGVLGYSWPVGSWKASMQERAQWFHFTAGLNDGRDDLFSRTQLSMDHDMGPATLSLGATLYRNFSDRSDQRYTDLEIGPTLALAF